MKNEGHSYIGADTAGYEDIRLLGLMCLPAGMTVMMVDTDDDDNVVMRDCVETPNCYCLAEGKERGRVTVYPYELSTYGGFDVRATVVPIRICPKCGKRLRPHMEECDTSTLYYTCNRCGHHEKGWPDVEEMDKPEEVNQPEELDDICFGAFKGGKTNE